MTRRTDVIEDDEAIRVSADGAAGVGTLGAWSFGALLGGSAQDCTLTADRLLSIERLARFIEVDGPHPHISGVLYGDDGRRRGIAYIGEEPGPGEFILWRSMGLVIRGLAQGFQAVDLARAVGVSKGFMSRRIGQLSDEPEVRAWLARSRWAGEIGRDAGA